MAEQQAGRTEEFSDGAVQGVGAYAVGISNGKPFAVTRRCRHSIAADTRSLQT